MCDGCWVIPYHGSLEELKSFCSILYLFQLLTLKSGFLSLGIEPRLALKLLLDLSTITKKKLQVENQSCFSVPGKVINKISTDLKRRTYKILVYKKWYAIHHIAQELSFIAKFEKYVFVDVVVLLLRIITFKCFGPIQLLSSLRSNSATIFVKILPLFGNLKIGNLLRPYSVFGKHLNLLWQKIMLLGKV